MGLFSSIGRMLSGRSKRTTQQAKQTVTEQAKVQPKTTMGEALGRVPRRGRGVVYGQMWNGKKAVQLKLAHAIDGYQPIGERKKTGKHRSQELQRKRKRLK